MNRSFAAVQSRTVRPRPANLSTEGVMALSTVSGPESNACRKLLRPLSLELREETGGLHRYTEQRLGFPEAITNLVEYRSCLERFYRLYRPLEIELAGFEEWPSIGIDLDDRRQSGRLARDLSALGVSPTQLADAPKASLPVLPDFAHALGALYVLEGSALGSQFILRHLAHVLGNEIGTSDSFFRGHGEETAPRWREFQRVLDRYGLENHSHIPRIVTGAKRTFQAIADWMQPLRMQP